MAFKTLSERVGEPEALSDGCPPHLRESLVTAIRWFASDSKYQEFSRERVLSLERESRVGGLLKQGGTVANGFEEQNFIANLRRLDDEFFLAVLDAAVRLDGGSASVINRLLLQGGSLYEVREVTTRDKKVRALERRLTRELADIEERIPDQRVRRELAEARSKIFGIAPDLANGMHHAVRAVEHIASGIVEPNNAKSTLGTVEGALRANQGGVFGTTIGDVGAVAAMCKALWDADRPHRHGSTPEREPDPPTREEAEAGYSLAVLLSDWFVRGVIYRRNP